MRITGALTAEEQAVVAAHDARLGFEASVPAIENAALAARTRDLDGITRTDRMDGTRSERYRQSDVFVRRATRAASTRRHGPPCYWVTP
jgi:hypothetical protein